MIKVFPTLLNDDIYAIQGMDDDYKVGVDLTLAYWDDVARIFRPIVASVPATLLIVV